MKQTAVNWNGLKRSPKIKRRRLNPYIDRITKATHPSGLQRVTGSCAFCGLRRAVNRDHVIPRSVLRSYNKRAPEDAPSVPVKWLEVVPSCFECNLRKGSRRLVPASWAKQVNPLNRFFGGTPWRVWTGDVLSPAYAEVHV